MRKESMYFRQIILYFAWIPVPYPCSGSTLEKPPKDKAMRNLHEILNVRKYYTAGEVLS